LLLMLFYSAYPSDMLPTMEAQAVIRPALLF
jgi:hypothetical protein